MRARRANITCTARSFSYAWTVAVWMPACTVSRVTRLLSSRESRHVKSLRRLRPDRFDRIDQPVQPEILSIYLDLS